MNQLTVATVQFNHKPSDNDYNFPELSILLKKLQNGQLS